MEIIFKEDSSLKEDVVILSARVKTKEIDKIINEFNQVLLPLYKNKEEYYVSISNILFFETSGNKIVAHTNDEMYFIKTRMYELENKLPANFIRVSKYSIINIEQVFKINWLITSSRKVEFVGTHKHVFASRFYFKSLKERIKERVE